MKIISKFHDYYDSAQRQGFDDQLLYVRHKETIPVTEARQSRPALQALVELALPATPTAWREIFTGDPSLDQISAEYGLLVFAGKLYPYARVTKYVKGATGQGQSVCRSEISVAYSPESLAELLGDHVPGAGSRRRSWGWRRLSQAQPFWQLRGDTRLMPVCLQDALACASFERSEHRPLRERGLLTVNPVLAELEFFKVVDTWQAYQELSMFHGNVAAPDRTPVHVADKDRVVQHGFDKWSFRKRPR